MSGIYRWGNARVNVPHWVYRYYNADDEVIYVGFTNDLVARDRAHRRSSRWRGEAVRIEVVQYPDRESARVAEGYAIGEYVPFYNLNGNGHRKQVHRARLEESALRRGSAFSDYWFEKTGTRIAP